jgi:hypothetical protein
MEANLIQRVAAASEKLENHQDKRVAKAVTTLQALLMRE